MSRLFSSYFTQKKSDIHEQRSAIEKVLKGGPASISKIAKTTNYEKDLIVWNLMGMLRWGVVEITGEEEHEMVFVLKEV
ncbi:MAG: hypothetical protein AM325_012485 [Candidatus Thorarchaeota archaeon SMTZ1-45]|nr:MAG: hypothetical protein AM325_14160 [Candidatus Thorarchaeota archaeon SMTZ1-45]